VSKRKGAEEIKFSFGQVFKGLGNFIELLSDLVEEEEGTEITRTREFKGKGRLKELKGVYGLSVKYGLGGRPVVESFGNIRGGEKGPVVEEVREPMVDIFDEADQLIIIAELPGVEEPDIKLNLKEDILILSAEGKNRKYEKELLLPGKLKSEGMTSTYKNGILEIKIIKG